MCGNVSVQLILLYVYWTDGILNGQLENLLFENNPPKVDEAGGVNAKAKQPLR